MHIAKPRTFQRNLNEKHVRFHNDVRSERERERGGVREVMTQWMKLTRNVVTVSTMTSVDTSLSHGKFWNTPQEI